MAESTAPTVIQLPDAGTTSRAIKREFNADMCILIFARVSEPGFISEPERRSTIIFLIVLTL